MREYGSTVNKVLELLTEVGPLTGADLCEMIGVTHDNLSGVLYRLRKPTKTSPKRIYIKRYVFEYDNARRYPRPVFAIGDKPNANRPKPNRKEVRRRYDQAKKARFTMNSVFNMGLPRRIYLGEKNANV